MSPFEDPDDTSSRYLWHYRDEYEGFYKKYQAKQKHEMLKQAILENQETYTLGTPKNPTVFERLVTKINQSSLGDLPVYKKLWINIKHECLGGLDNIIKLFIIN